MKYGQHDNSPRLNVIIKAVGEAADGGAADLSMHYGKPHGVTNHPLYAWFDLFDEHYPEVRSLRLLISDGIAEFGACGATINDRQRHRPIRARAPALTSLHGATSSGCFS